MRVLEEHVERNILTTIFSPSYPKIQPSRNPLWEFDL